MGTQMDRGPVQGKQIRAELSATIGRCLLYLDTHLSQPAWRGGVRGVTLIKS